MTDYLKRIAYPDELPERLLRDRLAEWLQHNPLHQRRRVAKEYGVEGIEGTIDILADEEAWELKTGQATAYDVYQLFMYMDVGGYSRGFLVAQGFTGGAHAAQRHISETHGKELILAGRDQFPINEPANENERQYYF